MPWRIYFLFGKMGEIGRLRKKRQILTKFNIEAQRLSKVPINSSFKHPKAFCTTPNCLPLNLSRTILLPFYLLDRLIIGVTFDT